ncbi:hypothetical protein HK099_005483 [Clydaea vesicula]|uniref:Phospholipid/glycerol acyltransferase domain-containing protein n=1 Tax=Clydaea vesicula TaxID=447962 RepID=A0AAD5U1J3_9FUNG|nr:hypothetical protein HK099_005483 [Clydaea vesicula]KAJ3393605.1 hypothetical protein HDU92_007644 [Lobulomyces angularis]
MATSKPLTSKPKPAKKTHLSNWIVYYILYIATAWTWRYLEELNYTLILFALLLILSPNRPLQKAVKAFMDYPYIALTERKAPPRGLVNFCQNIFKLFFPIVGRGYENIPKHGKVIFIGNHQLLGLDLAALTPEIYLQTGLFVRALADSSHQYLPIFKHVTEYFGACEASRANCQALMDDSQPILIFPGAANEVFKDERHMKYELQWRKRVGFAKMAIENGYTIVPFSSVGLEDLVTVKFSISSAWFWTLIGDKKRAAKNSYAHPESTRFPIPLPSFRYSKLYLNFGKPIDAKDYFSTEESIWDLREQVRIQVENLVQESLQFREKESNFKPSPKTVKPSISNTKESFLAIPSPADSSVGSIATNMNDTLVNDETGNKSISDEKTLDDSANKSILVQLETAIDSTLAKDTTSEIIQSEANLYIANKEFFISDKEKVQKRQLSESNTYLKVRDEKNEEKMSLTTSDYSFSEEELSASTVSQNFSTSPEKKKKKKSLFGIKIGKKKEIKH